MEEVNINKAKNKLKGIVDKSKGVIIVANEQQIGIYGDIGSVCATTCSLLDKIRKSFGDKAFESIIKAVQSHKENEPDTEISDDEIDKKLNKLSDLLEILKELSKK